MKPADIWTTLRLPTSVSANKPAFSLPKEIFNEMDQLHILVGDKFTDESYTDTDDPVPVPNIPEKRMPTPCN